MTTESNLISILFPTFNSISRFGKNVGNRYLVQSLDSLVAQTYKTFEVIINDNQSSDGTLDFLEARYGSDLRFRFMIDTRQRVPEEGIAEAFTQASGDFVIIANDDDFYNPNYLSDLYFRLLSKPSADLAYSNGFFVDENNRNGRLMTSPNLAEPYSRLTSKLSRAICYFGQRDLLPAHYGLFRKTAFQSLLPYRPFDSISANCDHRFMYNFHLKGMNNSFIDQPLMYYRDRSRNLATATPFVDSFADPLSIIDFYMNHEIKFLQACLADAMESDSGMQDPLLFVIAHLPLSLTRMRDLLRWLGGVPDLQSVSWTLRCEFLLKKVHSLIQLWSNINPRGIFEHLETSMYSVRTSSDLVPKFEQTLNELARLGFEFKIPSYPTQDFALKRMRYQPELSNLRDTAHYIGHQGPKDLVVLVNSFNLFPLLEDTFRSIRNQTLNSFDIFVMDGGSTDGSLEWIRDREDLSLISSSDRNFVDGLNIGLAESDHKYVAQCCVSDGYCDPDWFAKATSLMDSDASIDLVFGFPVVLNEDQSFGDIGWRNLFYADLTDSDSIRNHWLTKGFVLPEGNFVARREVFNECFPKYRRQIYQKCEPFLEFTSNFFSSSRRAVGIPTVANFGRTHPNQLGEAMRESRLHHVHDFRFLRQRWFFFVKQYLLPVHRYSKSHLRLARTIITQFDWKSASVICRRRIFSLIRKPF